jgi:mitotic spindle assembly checkpoint protein MAD2
VRLDYGINSILFQRGIYPDDMFSRVKKYGMNLLVTNDAKLLNFLTPLLDQIEGRNLSKKGLFF